MAEGRVIQDVALAFGGLVLGVGIGLWFGGARIQYERTKAYQRGRDGAFLEMAQHRRAHLRIVRDDELHEHAESNHHPHRGAN